MKKGFKKHTVSANVNNAAECINSFLFSPMFGEVEFQNLMWFGHWDGYQYRNKSFYCSDEDFRILKKRASTVEYNYIELC